MYAPSPSGQFGVVNGTQAQQFTAASQQTEQQQQQQDVLHQKSLQQFPQQQASQITTMSSNVSPQNTLSKFMPPTSAPYIQTPLTNGPMIPPTASNHAPINNLPNYLRPPTSLVNGPSLLTNGSGTAGDHAADANSATSSRTASPALHKTQPQMPVHLQQAQQRHLNSTAPSALSTPSNANQSAPANNFAMRPNPANSANLAASMQNLNLNQGIRNNAQVPMPAAISAAPTSLQTPFQGNYKTSALNTSNVQQSQMQPQALSANVSYVPPPSAANRVTSNKDASFYAPPNPAANLPPPMQQPLQHFSGQPAKPPTLPPNSNILLQQQQNNLNNNPSQYQTTAARKPMYPMPALHQQQQQQPYSQAYTQPQQAIPAPGVFNGQPTSAPLQYQSGMQRPYPQQPNTFGAAPTKYNQQLSVTQHGFNQLWGQETIDLLQNRHVLSPTTLLPPKISLHNQFHESINCNPNIIRCTVAKIPESSSLLQKSRLPLGILIHPFRDINSLPVIQCPNIVRCRLCRTYINPFVYFVDSKMWKCNLCYRVNELPEDFQYDPATKTYGDVTRRPEVRSSTIEFIAPSEYMLRPPQPAIYLFLFDVSIIAQQSGYLDNVCAVLSEYLDDMPGDARAQIGFIAYNSQVHFYSMAESYNQPHEVTLLDIDDPFLPRPDNLLVNLKECKELVKDLLKQLPKRFAESHDPGSALGAALQVAYKLMQASGGRITVFQTCLPNKGPGALEAREDPNNRSAKDVAHLNPATDFYKRYALECSGYQIAADLFLLNQQYSDLATISGISKHSGGCVHHFPLYQKTKSHHVDALRNSFKRYLVRKIGFEAVMRIRCTRGLQVHTFHGNFFVRSTDLLSLPNVNPDAGYGMQISYEENLSDVKTVCFQAALLYTNSEGERRIRVHTLCLPVTSSLPEVMHAADTEAIVGLLSKMAVDRSTTSNVADAREAFINATVDIVNAFMLAQNLPAGQTHQLIMPRTLSLLPLYILALLKHPAFRIGTSTRLDDRIYAMDCMKTLPLDQLMKFIYPEFYQIDSLFYNAQNSNANVAEQEEEEEENLPDVPRLQLSAEYLDSRSMFLLDSGLLIIVYVGLNVPVNILENVFGIKSTAELPDYYYGLPTVNSTENDILRRFIERLSDDKPYPPTIQIIRDTSTAKPQFIEKLVDDRSEASLSYYEFLQHIRTQVK